MTTRFYIINTILVTILFLSSASIRSQNLFFERIYDETLAQASYMIGDLTTGDAMVIDAKRDTDTYLQLAKDNQLKITKITETHIHADFLTGSRELKAATGAELLLSDEGGKDWQYDFPHVGLKDGTEIKVGKLLIKVMHTPGHTPEHIIFLLMDKNSQKVEKAITGDFIFIGDVGRPDLLEKAAGISNTMEQGARDLFSSINAFTKLNHDLEIWPGHGAGSFCGKTLKNIPFANLKDELQNNAALQFIGNEEDFVKYILEGQPTPPKYFAMMKHLNKSVRPMLIEVPKHPILSNDAFERAQARGVVVIDTRDLDRTSYEYVQGSLQLNGGKLFSTWMGSLLDYQQQFILITDKGREEDLTRKLMRIGMDNIYGFVTDTNLGYKTERTAIVDNNQFKSLLRDKKVQIIDVRSELEYDKNHIPGVKNIVYTNLANKISQLDKNKPIVVHCQSGIRAAIAYSILKQNGFTDVSNYVGGMNDWLLNGGEVQN
ncbi:MAG: MBL fold metallo-hydrolase [Saprospiraceae bacterium]|nr:MBL fold metallo-hydrolase [Saprospiraceae bacterium]